MDKVAMGKKARRDGMAFERKVREDLRSKGWIVDKWTNNVEFPEPCGKDLKLGFKDRFCGKYYDCCASVHYCDKCKLKLHPAKSFRGITRSNGFPDFIAFRVWLQYPYTQKTCYEVIAVESKMNGVLSKVEKEKCDWYLDNNIFSKILIASKCDDGIEYKEYGT